MAAQRTAQAEATDYEQELAGYLQERIKPGLNKGAIPLLARSIAKEIAHRERPDGAAQDAEELDEPRDEGDDEQTDEPRDELEDEPTDEGEDEPTDEVEDEPTDEVEDEAADEDEPDDEDEDEPGEQAPDFEADMRDLQEELGDEWILRFSVRGDEAWLTAEKADGSQHVEAQTADVLLDAVELLEEGGGRSG